MYGVELCAVRVMRGSLETVLLGRMIRIEFDNTTIVSYIFGTVGLSSGGYLSIGRFYNRDKTVSVSPSPFSTLARALVENG